MATAVTSFAFATTLQSWSSIAALASGETNGLDTVNGNPADALFGKLVGKTKATTAGAGMKLSQTLTAWGVPAGCTVTAVSVALDKKCVTAPGSAIGSGSFNTKLNLNAGASLNTGPTQTLSTTADSVWTTLGTGSNAALSGLTDTTLTHTLEVDILYTLSTTSSALTTTTWQIDWDNVVVTVTYSPDVPTAPNTPTAPQGNGQTALSWTDNANNGASITDHHVYLYAGPSGGAAVNTFDTLSAAASYTATGLTNGSPYYAEVTATNSAGESAHSTRSALLIVSALSFVNKISGGGGGTAYTPVVGNTLLVFAFSAVSAGSLSISDTAGNVWQNLGSVAGAVNQLVAFVAVNVIGSATTVSTSPAADLVLLAEYSTATSGQKVLVDLLVAGTTTTSPLALSAGTCRSADEFAVYAVNNHNFLTLTAPTGYTTRLGPTSGSDAWALDDARQNGGAVSISDTSTFSGGGELDGALLSLYSGVPVARITAIRTMTQAVNRANTY